jgi:hypothetical protein
MNLRTLVSAAAFYFVFVFCILYILFFPVPYYYFPNLGGLLSPVLYPFIDWTASQAGITGPFTHELWSDSTGHYVFTGLLLIFSLIISITLAAILKKEISPKLKYWFYTFLSYYLALMLLKYGADKIFKHQFYLPEPNTLFTPVGQLTPDMLFWSTMGSSYSYTVFSGIIEIIPALFLLFRKTRLAGILITFAVMLNVVMINFGFDVTVKLFSLFLLFLTLVLLAPYCAPIYHFFTSGEKTAIVFKGYEPDSKKKLLRYTVLKTCVIGLFLYESTGFYFETGNLNDDLAPRHELHGAYEVYLFTDMGKIIPASMSYPGRFRRIFFHRRNYFIVQTMDDHFIDYKVDLDEKNKTITLKNSSLPAHQNLSAQLTYKIKENDLVLYGYFFDSYITLYSRKIDLQQLPLLREKIHWTIDGFKDSLP